MIYGNMLCVHELMTDDDFLRFIESQPDDSVSEKSAIELYSDFLREINKNNPKI